MAPTKAPEFPRRLLEGDDRSAALIQRALAEPALGPTEQQSFRKLRQRSERALRRWHVPAASFAFAAGSLLVWLVRSSPAPALGPDVWSRSRLAPAASGSAATTASAAATLPAAQSARAVPERARAPVRPAASGDVEPCARLAKQAKYQPATACYAEIARGSSMAAELALYEKARLEAKALGQPARALTTLDEYGQRFTGGVLSAEVGLTRIELLSQLGRRSEALQAIDAGLHSGLGRERGGDLQLLRADLLAAAGDCAGALGAASLASALGVHASRVALTERRCSGPRAANPAPEPGSSSEPRVPASDANVQPPAVP